MPEAVTAAAPRASSILHGSSVYAVANLLQRGLSLLLLPIYARHFARAEFGAMDQLYQGVLIVSLVTSFGLPQGLVRGFYLDSPSDDDRRRLIGAMIVLLLPITLVTAVLMVIGRHWLAESLFGTQGRLEWIALSAVLYVALMLQQLPLQLFRTEQQPGRYAMWSIFTFLSIAGGTVYLVVFRGWGLTGMLVGNAVGFGLGAVLLAPTLVRAARWNLELRRLRPLFAFGLPMLPALLGRKVLEVADRYMIPVYHGLDTLGPYVVAAKVANILDVLLLVPFLYAWQPFFYAHADDPSAGRVFARVTEGFFGVLCAAVLALAATRNEVLRLLGGGRYDDAGPIVVVLALAVLLNGMQYCISPGIHLKKKLPQEMGLMLAAAALNMALNLALIPRHAAWGAAVATAIAYGFYLVATFALAQRHFPVSYPWARLATNAALALGAFAIIEASDGLAWRCAAVACFVVAGPVRDLWSRGEHRSIVEWLRRGLA